MNFRPVLYAASNRRSAPPQFEALVSVTIGTPRTDFSGYVGFQFIVGAVNITVKQLGRYVLLGNSGSHAVSIRDSGGTPITSTTVNTSGQTVGAPIYGTASSEVVLTAGSTYYVLSQETLGGDTWGDQAAVTPSSDLQGHDFYAACFSASSSGVPSLGDANMAFVPLNFKYTV